MKPARLIVTLVVVANLVLVGWLLFRAPDQPLDSLGEAVSPLVSTSTLEGARYHLSDRVDELNIILISLDALRYDMTGIGGSKRGLTPNLDQFATESVVFHDAVASAPWTLPSHMSVWTGRWPSVHGVTEQAPFALPGPDGPHHALARHRDLPGSFDSPRMEGGGFHRWRRRSGLVRL